MVCVECYVVQSCFLFRNNLLSTDRVIFIHIQVKNMYLAIYRDSGKYCAWVWSPCDIPNLRIQIKHEKSFPKIQINLMPEIGRLSHNFYYMIYIMVSYYDLNLTPPYDPKFWSSTLQNRSRIQKEHTDSKLYYKLVYYEHRMFEEILSCIQLYIYRWYPHQCLLRTLFHHQDWMPHIDLHLKCTKDISKLNNNFSHQECQFFFMSFLYTANVVHTLQ